MIHKLLHRFKWLEMFLTSGFVDHERDENGVWWVGLRCGKCGKLMDKTHSRVQ